MEFVAYGVLGLFAFLFGSCTGSFINVVAYRLPRKLDMVKGRSFCPACGKTLKAYDMIPVLSFFCLKGRCRFCKEKISPRYPAVEALSGAVALACVWVHGYTLAALIAFSSCAVLLAVALIDWDTQEIPNGLVLALAVPALAAIGVFPEVSLLSRGIGLVAVSLPMLAMALLIKNSFGGGDIKLMAVCGLLLGWQQILVGTFFALLTAGGYGAYLLATHKKGRKDTIAFGPFLAAGVALALLAGEPVLHAYLSLFI
ncbi:prepilin peptidase [Christensenellaceae bacterium NSJ-44]|uniref:Prepilin peptidase n=1 Tax=Luoshenia tenuis TaxID=2763654 RepID=A0A926HPE4_9FIRM|nr:A24 family peptidase [Luoshenia tenuis]MBC8530106.1 prepilin peptidase [Luoshenia tenuis]